jgi:hypothetical protein
MTIKLISIIVVLTSCLSDINNGITTQKDSTQENTPKTHRSHSNHGDTIVENSSDQIDRTGLLFRTSGNLKVITADKYSMGYDEFPMPRRDSSKHKIECDKWHLTREAIQEILINLKPAISYEEFNTIAVFRECGYRGICEYNRKRYYYDLNSGGWATVGFYKYGLHSFGAWRVNQKFLDTFSISD